MDYLDPKKKRAHRIRLLVGYALFGVAIGLATVLLVFMANGYDVDTSTGEVIQNGLVFVDSNPGGAEVYLNGQKQRGTTDLRLVIPGGENYNIEVKKAGYRDWSRELSLEGGSLRELTYTRLIPEELQTQASLDLRSNPVQASQSIDKRWLVLSYADEPLKLSLIDLDADPVTHTDLQLPTAIVANPNSGVLEVVEWADDNRFLLASYTVGDSVSYIMIDTRNPEEAQNLNTLFGSKAYEVSLQDRKRDRFFVFNTDTKILYRATVSGGVEAEPVISEPLLEFAVFGDDWVTYIIESGKEGLVEARFKRGSDDILIKELKTDSNYLVELAKLGDEPIMAVSSPIENKVVVFRDPQKYLAENSEARLPIATTVLRVDKPEDVIVSSDSSVVLAYGTDNMASHEFEADRSYNFIVKSKLDADQEPRWLDGQHFSFSSGGVQHMIDFDGSNLYDLVPSIPRIGSFYSSSVEDMYSFTAAVSDEGGTVTTPSRMNYTSLLIEADR